MTRSYPYLKSAQTVYKEWLDRLLRRWYLSLPIFWSRKNQLSPKLTALAIPAPDPTSSRGTFLFAMLGLTGRTLEEVLELVAKEVEVNSITAVFVTELAGF